MPPATQEGTASAFNGEAMVLDKINELGRDVKDLLRVNQEVVVKQEALLRDHLSLGEKVDRIEVEFKGEILTIKKSLVDLSVLASAQTTWQNTINEFIRWSGVITSALIVAWVLKPFKLEESSIKPFIREKQHYESQLQPTGDSPNDNS
jgi:hypothetical protein